MLDHLGPARREIPIGALALGSTVVSITAVLVGLARIGPVQTSTLSTMEPITTVIVSALFMNKSLSWIQLCGGALIVTAAVIVARSSNEQPNVEASVT